MKSSVNYWTLFPSHHPFRVSPEDATILRPGNPALTNNDTSDNTLPGNLGKSNPSFHVILPARHATPELARLLTSAMILNYPPPTLVGYGKPLPEGSTEYDAMVESVKEVYTYLESSGHVDDQNFVLVLDGVDFFFQLPAEVMVKRFQSLMRETNAKLRKKYGIIVVDSPDASAAPELMQKYSQRVLFGASKTCLVNHNMTQDPGCVTVPQSSLPPDVYGWKTDVDSEVGNNRPRWLNPSMVMGQAADVKPVFAQILQVVQEEQRKEQQYQQQQQQRQKHNKYTKRRDSIDSRVALTQMYGRQEYIRELERSRSSNAFMQLMYYMIGISDASNITGAIPPSLTPGSRYEYGMGVDSQSHVFFDMAYSHRDMEWLHYSNATRSSLVQMEHGVPREHRLLLPTDLLNAHVANPFYHPNLTKEEQTKANPPYNATLDFLPNYKVHSYHSMPLLTTVRTPSVPALVRVDGDRLAKDGSWKRMWYSPWARALLRRYMRMPLEFDAAQAALLGGQDWWDLRGGKGGVWTDLGQWLGFEEVCRGFERDIFEDGFGAWGKELGESNDGPVYNQFGNLVKGKEG